MTTRGERDVLRIWTGDGGEGAKFWLSVLTEFKNRRRGGRVHRGLRRFRGPVGNDTTLWEHAQAQTCVFHLIRNTFRYAARQDWGQDVPGPEADLQGGERRAGRGSDDDFAEEWDAKYPAVGTCD
ncbi:transposase [Cellulomonas sp. PhB143]|uniref:transposase n=1 Tax=Cellulomonas sp. PhB143 TaxID=2485186 RepID=UPI0013156A90|nr:transposase [Cellulomonas sp. PhB143]